MNQQTGRYLATAEGKAAAPVGHIISVRGPEAHFGLVMQGAEAHERTTVGKFMIVNAGTKAIVGTITEVSARRSDDELAQGHRTVARIALVGEIEINAEGEQIFRRGVSDYPAIGDTVHPIGSEELRLIYNPAHKNSIEVGRLNHDTTITARIDADNLISKHFAILGSTGVGKSSGVTVILKEILKARPDVRVFLLDGHNEYGGSFGAAANVICSDRFKLPFWLFNFEELTDVIFGGRPAMADEVEILCELIPIAKGIYLQYKSTTERIVTKKSDPKRTGYTVDTPVPYLLQDLLSLIDDRMGKLENRASRMSYHRLMMRIETIKNDPRYAFMFENASVGGDTMADLLCDIFRLDPAGKPISVMQLGGLPVEVVDAVVCLLCRLAFDFGHWSEGKIPMLFVCEEAHRYASIDHNVGFAPTRRALSRMAKEGRKYGLSLGLVTQRPTELDPTIISQCSTLFAMRMPNDRDQALLKSAVSDAATNLLDFVPALATGEVIGFGEAMPVPARFCFHRLAKDALPLNDSRASTATGQDDILGRQFVESVVERWRGVARTDDTPRLSANKPDISAANQPRVSALAPSLLDNARQKILRR